MTPTCRTLCAWLIGCLAAFHFSAPLAAAHEGHAALPSTGVTRDGRQLLISPSAIKAMGLETARVTIGDMSHSLRVNARVELPWRGKAKVTTLAAGRLDRWLVKPGQRVVAGQELARLRSPHLESAQSDLLQAAAEVRLLERLEDQRSKLVSSGGVAASLLLRTKSDLRQRRVQYAIAFRELVLLGLREEVVNRIKETGQTVRSLSIVAPMAGTVEKIDTRVGQIVDATDHLIDLIDGSRLMVVGEVLESDAYQVRPGQAIEFSVAGLSGRRFRGTVDHLRPKLDSVRRVLQAVVIVDNRDAALRPGMFGRMAIQVASQSQQVVCPLNAIVETSAGSFVLKRDTKGKFVRQKITTGMRSQKLIVVTSGVFPGQEVITTSRHLLEGMYETENQLPDEKTSRRTVPKGRVIRAARAAVHIPTSQKAAATSLIEGRVARLVATPGMNVKAGDVLAEVESHQLQALLLKHLQSNSKLAWNRSEIDRLRPLAETGKASNRELWQVELAAQSLDRRLFSLERRLELVGMPKLEVRSLRGAKLPIKGNDATISGRIKILAPIDGQIAEAGLLLGQFVHAHDTMFEIHDAKVVWIKALILEQDAGLIRRGQTAQVTFPANPQLRLAGKIVRMAPNLESRERVLPVWIEVANPDGFLKDDMLADVEVRVAG